MWESGNFERFQYSNFETNFLENETFIKKLEYLFLVESSKIENASFPYKTAFSEVSVKTNRIESIESTYHKDAVLPVTTSFIWKFYFKIFRRWQRKSKTCL